MIKVIVFDVGGVLIRDPEEIIFNMMSDILKLPIIEIKNKLNNLVHDLTVGMISLSIFYERLNLIFPKLNGIDYFSKFKNNDFHINKKLFILIDKLRKKGYKTAILSNSVISLSNYNRELNLYNGFDPIILSEEIGLAKPDKRIYEYLLKKIDLKPEEVVFIDDRKENIESAKNLGIKTILYNYELNLEEKLKDFEILI